MCTCSICKSKICICKEENIKFLIDCMNRMPISMSDLNSYDRQQSKDSILILYLEEK